MAKKDQNHAQVLSEFGRIRRECTLISACGREFVRIHKLKNWMVEGDNTKRLGYAAYDAASIERMTLPIVDKIDDEKKCALVVFSILLDLGQGALIEFFHRNGYTDHRLPISKWELRWLYEMLILESDYQTLLHGESAPRLEEKFSNRQYAFCPMTFDLEDQTDYISDVVLPVTETHKTLINEKGGTASVWQISILEEFIGPRLRDKIKTARFDDHKDELGPRFRVALKQFQQSNRQFFKTEIEAFQALSNHEGMIQYLGDFGHKDKMLNTFNYNILLEYGQLDLDEYFFDQSVLPPVLEAEIDNFWDDLFDIAGVLKKLHRFKVKREDISEEYYGWHADIKPDNILWVNGKFKLADPGFASFKKVEGTDKIKKRVKHREDATFIRGGTVTYGAPECYSGKDRTPVTRAIDIWSFGCVLSVAATWVILGHQGILQFTKLRERAIQQIISRNSSQNIASSDRNGNSCNLTPGDYFHDGSNVLQIVTEWHRHLRYCKRASDHITDTVLDVIDQQMLCCDPDHRIEADKLDSKLNDLVFQSRTKHLPQTSQVLTDAFEALDKIIASQPAQSKLPELITPLSTNSTLSVAERKERKSRLLEIPLKRTTHRSDAFRKSRAASNTSTMSVTIDQGSLNVVVPVPTIIEPPGEYSEPFKKQNDVISNAVVSTKSRRKSEVSKQESASDPGISRVNRQQTSGLGGFDLARIASAPPQVETKRLKKQNPWQARAELDQKNSNLMSRLTGPKKNIDLTPYFKNRDLFFLIDNAASMADFWDEAKWLLKILIEKVVGQDDDGMDMCFTNGGREVKGCKKSAVFMDTMDKARPLEFSTTRTDITRKLGVILDDYLYRLQNDKLQQKNRYYSLAEFRKLTIFIFTDGLWDAMPDKNKIGTRIADFARSMQDVHQDTLTERQVSFQFIRFGNDEEARYRLKRLDDDLSFEQAIPDIIDTVESTGDVVKMLLGSFRPEFDPD